MEETLFINSNNKVVLQLLDSRLITDEFPRGTPFTFIDNNTDKMVLFINGDTLSSDDNDITWDNNGTIFISSNNADKISSGIGHSTSLKVYDDENPTHGLLLIHPRMPNSNLKLEVVNAEV